MSGVYYKDEPWIHKIQKGLIPGYELLDKFGGNNIITSGSAPEDITETGGLYQFSPSLPMPVADIISVSSDDPNDNQLIEYFILNELGYPIRAEVQLDGQNRVALPVAGWRFWRGGVISEQGDNPQGNIYFYSGTENTGGVPSGASIEKARIEVGNNQTQMAVYTVPLGKVALLLRGEVGIQWEGGLFSGSQAAKFKYFSRRYKMNWRVKKTVTALTSGNSNYQDKRETADIIPALTDIRLTAEEVSDTMGVFGTFDMLLIDENQFTDERLAEIGQPFSV